MKFISYHAAAFKKTPYYAKLPSTEQEIFNLLTSVFHFKVNNYVLEHLIKWEDVPHDPIYKIIFPRKDMLPPFYYEQLKTLHRVGINQKALGAFVEQVKQRIYPVVRKNTASMPHVNGKHVKGLYSNFDTIVSLFPDPMVKTCHAYCSYCFRWIMFNNREVQEETSYRDPQTPVEFLQQNPQISDVLFTGADPLVLKAETLKKYVDPILEIDSVEVVRFSSKSLAWWPYRFTTDADAKAVLELFEYIQSKGRHVNFCAHFTHAQELENEVVKEAIQNIRATGANIRCQGPMVQGINDTAQDWIDLWTSQIQLGMIPYYMFVEADHHSESCFRVPLAKSLKIFQEAQRKTTGLARTVRGPVFMNDLNRVLLLPALGMKVESSSFLMMNILQMQVICLSYLLKIQW